MGSLVPHLKTKKASGRSRRRTGRPRTTGPCRSGSCAGPCRTSPSRVPAPLTMPSIMLRSIHMTTPDRPWSRDPAAVHDGVEHVLVEPVDAGRPRVADRAGRCRPSRCRPGSTCGRAGRRARPSLVIGSGRGTRLYDAVPEQDRRSPTARIEIAATSGLKTASANAAEVHPIHERRPDRREPEQADDARGGRQERRAASSSSRGDSCRCSVPRYSPWNVLSTMRVV